MENLPIMDVFDGKTDLYEPIQDLVLLEGPASLFLGRGMKVTWKQTQNEIKLQD